MDQGASRRVEQGWPLRQDEAFPTRLSASRPPRLPLAAPPLYVVLDGASALLTLAVALGFMAIARWSRSGLHYLVASGFILLALGFAFVAASHFEGGVGATAADALRIFCQLSGSFLLLFAYGSYNLTGRAHAAVVVASAFGLVVALAAIVYWIVPPLASLPPLPEYFAFAYGLMSASFLGCALFSGYGWHRRPTLGRALVPLGFLCWTLSTYTWIFIVLADAGQFLPVVYSWRFAAILLMLGAMVRRPRFPSARFPDAPA
jgi:hypothetical protein